MTSAADARIYTIQDADFVGVIFGQKPVYRLIATYRDALGYEQNLTALATVNLTVSSPHVPQGSVDFGPSQGTTDGRTDYSANQTYGGTLNITNSASGGDIAYQFQVAPESRVFWAGV